jgi:hypothetical protein
MEDNDVLHRPLLLFSPFMNKGNNKITDYSE